MSLKSGVIGVGFMGALHCKAYSIVDGVDFVGIFDLDRNKSKEISNQFKVLSFETLDNLLSNVDIVSICVPTINHYEVCLKCLDYNKHFLVEKPLAATLDQAIDLVARLEKKNLVACVGYIERFNSVVIELQKLLKDQNIQKVETLRCAPPANRANDVSVVFDLMIHDIDVVLSILDKSANPIKVEAIGEKIDSIVFNKASANVLFNNGCNAIFFADKTASEKKRVIKIWGEDFFIEADLLKKRIYHNKVPQINTPTLKEPIILEVENFVKLVKGENSLSVLAKDSIKSFQIAWEIEEKLF